MEVFVLPSLYEGLPVVGVEVQTNGLAFICSDKVTDEILLTDNIKLLSLQQSKIEWCDAILNAERKEVLNNENSLLKNFDIKNESRKLEELYLGW